MQALERELQCSVCNELYCDPVRLQCTHHVCAVHVPSLTTGRILPCPVCGDVTQLPPDGLPPAKAFSQIVDMWREKTIAAPQQQQRGSARGSGAAEGSTNRCGKTDESGLPLCGFCEEKPATRFCLDCPGLLCMACEKSLHTKGFLKSHTVVDRGIGDDIRGVPADDDEFSRRMRCDQHPQEKLNFFCCNCQVLICSHCLILGDHKGHQPAPIEQAGDTGRESLSAHLEQMRKRLGAVDDVLSQFRIAEVDVQNGAEAQRNIINSELDHLRELIETKRQQLLSKSALEEKQKRVHLQTQVQSMEAVRENTDDLIARSSSLLEVENHHAFLAVVLPLIQEMKKGTTGPVDGPLNVSCGFRPLSTDAQVRCLGDLDLGHPSPPTAAVVPPGPAPPLASTPLLGGIGVGVGGVGVGGCVGAAGIGGIPPAILTRQQSYSAYTPQVSPSLPTMSYVSHQAACMQPPVVVVGGLTSHAHHASAGGPSGVGEPAVYYGSLPAQ